MNAQNQQSVNYQIENNVPVPVKRYARKSKYPFGDMGANQSVLISGKSYSAIIGVLRKYKAEGKKFVIRKAEGGLRIWRTE